MSAPYPELLSIPLDAGLADRITRFVAPLERHLSWRDASRIPRQIKHGTAIKGALSLASAALGRHHLYLAPVPGHALARRAHGALRGARAARLFDFLCLNRTLDARELAFAYDAAAIDAFVASQTLLRRGESLMLPVTLAPWGDRYYFTESLHLRENAEAYGIRGAPLDPETDLQIRWLSRALNGRRYKRFLELGTGTGVVLLELAHLAEQREGGEYERRSLCFAEMNGHRWDPSARFFWTDMFSGARGRYDLMHFAPWQPSESSLHLLTAFIEGLPTFLEEDGEATMFVSHYGEADDDVVLTPLADAMARNGLSAAQDLVAAFSDASGRVVGQSFLRLRRRSASKPITLEPSAAYAIYRARRAAA